MTIERILARDSLMLSMQTATHNAPGSRGLETANSRQSQPGGHSDHPFQQPQRHEGAYY